MGIAHWARRSLRGYLPVAGMRHNNARPRGHSAARVALVTGAFSGIGEATALELARAGWIVYAAGRTMSKSAALVAAARSDGADVRPIHLDVTDEGSIAVAMEGIWREAKRLDVVVNNAGFVVHGAVTEVSNVQLRQQFETNSIAAVAVSRAALELMRRNGGGRIINISSVGGKIAFPGSGAYAASKFALEALSDAMRLEVKLIGRRYHVIVVETPTVKTKIGDNALYAEYGDAPQSLYGAYNTLVRAGFVRMYNRAPGPRVVAKAVLSAASASHPKPRYVATTHAKIILALRRLLPDRVFDRIVLALTPRLAQQMKARAKHNNATPRTQIPLPLPERPVYGDTAPTESR